MQDRGYPAEFAERIFKQMLGFGEYGFPECVVGQTRVVDADSGRWVRIDDVVSGRVQLAATLACDKDLKLRRRQVVAARESGVKPVWRLRTALGHTITATAEHPFLTPEGWRPLGQLAAGSYVAAARSLIPVADSDIYWDRVASIEKRAEEPTYDLQIEGDHNFLANHLVVHNSHSMSFALLVYDSAWLKHHEPAAFCCALLNSQPMGFYAPAQLVRDARAHGVEVRPVDACASAWDSSLERGADGAPVLRLGMRLVKSLSEAGVQRLLVARAARAFTSVQDLSARAGLDRGDLEALAAAGAFAALSGNRHLAFWEVAGTERELPLGFAETGSMVAREGWPLLPQPTEGQGIVADYAALGLTLGRHPLALLRPRLTAGSLLSAQELKAAVNGAKVRTAGIVLMRQRPGTASGVTFLTLEDESGQVNVIVWERIGREQRPALLESRLLEVHGELQQQEGVCHLIAHRLIDRSSLLGELLTRSRDFH
jgi:DNA polymerase III alpha subunit